MIEVTQRVTSVLLFFAVASCSNATVAEEKNKEKQLQNPSVGLTVPISAQVGRTNKVIFRGHGLRDTTEVKTSDSAVSVEIVSKGDATLPGKLDATKVGDSQVELEVRVPAGHPAAKLDVVVVTPHGESQPWPLLLSRAEHIVGEIEPNRGFRDAQPVQFGQIVEGVIERPRDVDVFRIEGKARQEIVIEALACCYGSPCDARLTIHQDTGAILCSNDDREESSDPRLEFALPSSGVYFIALTDANDAGSNLHQYRLSVHVAD